MTSLVTPEPDTIYQIIFHCECDEGHEDVAYTDAEGVRLLREEELMCRVCWTDLIPISSRYATAQEVIDHPLLPRQPRQPQLPRLPRVNQ